MLQHESTTHLLPGLGLFARLFDWAHKASFDVGVVGQDVVSYQSVLLPTQPGTKTSISRQKGEVTGQASAYKYRLYDFRFHVKHVLGSVTGTRGNP